MKKVGLNVLAVVMVAGFAGCATTPPPHALNVKDADTAMVANCKFLGDVTGSSGWGGLAASTGMQNSMNEAREKAANMGATNIVWASTAGGWAPYASGKAYMCK